MTKISLENMEFHAFHGCLEHEQKFGNLFFVSITMEVDTSLADESDQLVDTIDYQQVYNVVKEEMEKPSKLLEHVAKKIMDHLFMQFPQIDSLEVKVSKFFPPLGGKVEKATVQMFKSRQ